MKEMEMGGNKTQIHLSALYNTYSLSCCCEKVGLEEVARGGRGGSSTEGKRKTR